MVRALDPAVVSVLWQAIYHHLPEHVDDHPLGCHRKRDAADANGIPIGVAIAGANRNDIRLLEPTLDSIITNGLLDDIELLALDRGYDFPVIRERLAGYDLTELEIQKRGTKPPPGTPHRLTLGLRWIVEALNSWFSNYGHYVERGRSCFQVSLQQPEQTSSTQWCAPITERATTGAVTVQAGKDASRQATLGCNRSPRT